MARYHDVRLTRQQAWVTLGLTVACESVATLSVKASDGLTRLLPTAVALVGFALTSLLLAKVVEVVPTSIAYTVWTGSGTVVVALVGVLVFDDHLSPGAWLGIGLVLVGVITLNRVSPGE